MAIVINGSGTITGISAGGLPDGTVTADDLASTLDLSGKTVTLAAGGTGYGKVLQVVTDTSAVVQTTSSTAYINTGLSAGITPSSTSSKILILTDLQTTVYKLSSGYFRSSFNILRNATQVSEKSHGLHLNVGTDNNYYSNFSSSYIDSPSTTSTVTYTVQMKNAYAGSTLSVDSGTSTLILMEIAA